VSSLDDLADLIDRLISDDLRNGYEWDDFVAWNNSNPQVEAVRKRIEEFQGLLLSPSLSDKYVYYARIKEIAEELRLDSKN